MWERKTNLFRVERSQPPVIPEGCGLVHHRLTKKKQKKKTQKTKQTKKKHIQYIYVAKSKTFKNGKQKGWMHN